MATLDEIWERRAEGSSAVKVNVPPGLFLTEDLERSLGPIRRIVTMWCIGGNYLLYWYGREGGLRINDPWVDSAKVAEITFSGLY